MTSNIAGHSKRTLTNGLWFVWYAAGNIIGAQIFFTREAPRYQSAIIALCICYGAIIVLGGVMRQYMWWENRRRDKAMGVGERTVNGADEQAMQEGFKDVTDLQNKHFRYCL